MASLTSCLAKSGLPASDKDTIKGIYQDHLANGLTGDQAAQRAVYDFLQNVMDDRQVAVDKITSLGGQAPAAPVYDGPVAEDPMDDLVADFTEAFVSGDEFKTINDARKFAKGARVRCQGRHHGGQAA